MLMMMMIIIIKLIQIQFEKFFLFFFITGIKFFEIINVHINPQWVVLEPTTTITKMLLFVCFFWNWSCLNIYKFELMSSSSIFFRITIIIVFFSLQVHGWFYVWFNGSKVKSWNIDHDTHTYKNNAWKLWEIFDGKFILS